VCDFFTLREAYQGEFDISGKLFVYDDASFGGMVNITGNTFLHSNLSVLGDTSLNGNLFVGGDESLVGQFFLGDNSSQYFYGLPDGTGIGLNTLAPQATLDIHSNQISALNIFSNQTENLNTIAQNNENYGITVDAKDYTSTINFYGRDENTFSVSTVAGNLNGTKGTQDGSGTNILFNFPLDICTDKYGDFYIMDADVIRKMTVNNNIYDVSSVAGTPGVYGYQDGIGFPTNSSITNSFNYPFGIAVDNSLNLYIADTNNNLIRKATLGLDGIYTVSTIAGDVNTLNAKGYYNTGKRNLKIPVPNGENVGLNGGWHDGVGTDTSFNLPSGIVVDNSGNILVADSSNNVIRKLTRVSDTSYNVTTVAGNPLIAGGWQDGSGSNAHFKYPFSLAKDKIDGIYVIDAYNNVVRKMTYAEDGSLNVVTIAGFYGSSGPQYQDGIGTNALFNFPGSITVNDDGSIIYVADTGNSLIRKVQLITSGPNDGSYNVTTVAGTAYTVPGSSTSIGFYNLGKTDGVGNVASFRYPAGITLDLTGNLFVSDTNNQTIRKVYPISDTYNNQIYSMNPAAQIIYNSDYINGKTVEITVPDDIYLNSTVSISIRTDEYSHITQETLVIYDISYGPFLPLVYDQPSCITGNALSLIANDLSSNTFLNITTPLDITGNTKGIAIGGGAYPTDTNRSMGVIGWTDLAGTFQSAQTIVSGSDPIKYKSTVGINTYHPITEQYVMDINGPVRLSNGTIVNTGNQSFEIKAMGVSRIDPTHLIAVGSPTTIGNGLYIPYTYNALVSTDAGSSWRSYPIQCTDSSNNTSFQQSSNIFLSVYVYDSSYAVIGSDFGYMFYTVNGGRSWAKITLTNISFDSSINSIYMTPFDNQAFDDTNIQPIVNSYLQNNITYTGLSFSSTGQYQLLITDGSGIFVSEDYGNNWLPNTTARSPNASYTKISILNKKMTSAAISIDGTYQIAFGSTFFIKNGNFGLTDTSYNVTWLYWDISSVFSSYINSPVNFVSCSLYNDNACAVSNDPSGILLFFANYGSESHNLYIQNMTKISKPILTADPVYPLTYYISSNGNGIYKVRLVSPGVGIINGPTLKNSSSYNFTSISTSYDGWYITAVTDGSGIAVSDNSGNSWNYITDASNNGTRISILNIQFTDISISDNGKIQFATTSNKGIFSSLNYGLNWSYINDISYNYNSIQMSGDANYIEMSSYNYGNFKFSSNNKRVFFSSIPKNSSYYFDLLCIPSQNKDISSNIIDISNSSINNIAIDGYFKSIYNSNYIFFTDNSGITIYNVNQTNFQLFPLTIPVTDLNVVFNKLSVIENYALVSSNDLISFISFDIINQKFQIYNTSIIDNSYNLGSNLFVKNIFLYNNNTAVGICNNNVNKNYIIYKADYGEWKTIKSDILNSSGSQGLLSDPSNNFTNIVIPNIDTLLISNTTQNFSDSNKKIGASNIFNCFFPNLYNSDNDIVLDISGTLRVSDNIILNDYYANNGTINNINIDGTINFSDNSIIFSNLNAYNYSVFLSKWRSISQSFYGLNMYIYNCPQQCIAISSTGQYQNIFCATAAFYSNNYGIDWHQSTFNFNIYQLNSFYHAAGIAVSSNGKYVTIPTYPNVAYSHDYGVTYQLSKSVISALTDNSRGYNVAMSSSGQYQTAQYSKNIYYSHDFGVTWNLSTFPFITQNQQNYYLISIACSGNGKYQIIGFTNTFYVNDISGNYNAPPSGIYISQDYGETWTTNIFLDLEGIFSVSMSNSGKYITVSTNNTNLYNNIYCSSNYGLSFIKSNILQDISLNGIVNISMTGDALYQLALVSPVDIGNHLATYYGTQKSTIYKSTDFGLTWKSVSADLSGNFVSIAMSANGQYIGAIAASPNTTPIYWYSVTPYPTLYTDGIVFTVPDVSFVLNSLTITGNLFANSYNVTSDYRIKKNVALLDEAFVVDDLRPITYFNEMTEKQDIGFLAHEVQELYPYLVSGSKDDPGYQSLNYIGLIGILVKEIKELKRAVKELSEKQ
jgi:hypothetical protein